MTWMQIQPAGWTDQKLGLFFIQIWNWTFEFYIKFEFNSCKW
jgi:hypothetical protein